MPVCIRANAVRHMGDVAGRIAVAVGRRSGQAILCWALIGLLGLVSLGGGEPNGLSGSMGPAEKDRSAALEKHAPECQRLPELRASGQPGPRTSGESDGSAGEPRLTFKLPEPTPEQEKEDHRARVAATCFSPTGRYLALGLHSGRLVVLDLDRGRLALVSEAHSQPLTLLEFAENDRHLITGSDDLDVRFWDIQAGKNLVTFQGAPLRHLDKIAISNDSRFAAARGFDGFGTLWDLHKDKKVTGLYCYMLEFDPTCGYLVTGQRLIRGARLIRMATDRQQRRLLTNRTIVSLAVHPSGKTIAFGAEGWGEPSTLVLVKAASGRERRELSVFKESKPTIAAMRFSKAGKRLLVGSSDSRVFCIDVATGDIVPTFRFTGSVNVRHVEFLGRDGGRVMAWGRKNYETWETRCWKVDSKELIWSRPHTVACDGSGRLGARVTADGDVELLALADGARVSMLRGYVQGKRWRVIKR